MASPDERPEFLYGFDAWYACIELSALYTCLNRKQRCAEAKHQASVALDGDEILGTVAFIPRIVSR